jgi:tetratricopeptide (TPR) repeat protein
MKLAYLPLILGYCSGFYLLKMIWPAGLVSDYPAPQPLGLANPEVLATVVAMTVVLAALVLSTRHTRAWVAGGLFFLVTVLPTLGLIRYTSSVAANRSMYLPMVGILLPLNWMLNRLWNRGVGALKVSGVRAMVVGVAVALATGNAWATRKYESHWNDSVTLLRYYLTQTPNEWKLHTRLGNEWIQRGDYPSAIAEFREAVRLNPRWTENQLNLGRALFTVGQYGEAKPAFEMALRQTPKDWRAHMLMGTTLTRQNDLEGALEEFRTAAGFAPNAAVARYNIGDILARQGKVDEAVEAYRQTLRIDPNYKPAKGALDTIMAKRP